MAKNILIVLVSLCASTILSAVGSNALDETLNGRKIATGFVGARGKRAISIENENNGMAEVAELDKSTIQPTSSSIRFLIENKTNDFAGHNDVHLRNLPELSIFKRAPSGFMGMRGKKDFEYFDYSAPTTDETDYILDWPKNKRVFLQGINRGGLLYNSETPKRTPSGFIALKGKKAIEGSKRIPTIGFYGVRGKKNNHEAEDLYDQLENLLQSEYEFYDEYHPDNDANWQMNEPNKRTPNQGFFGMRGKRYPINEQKRTPIGFIGMRGRRFIDDESSEPVLKRQPNNGFFGMRGKKDVSDQVQQLIAERQLEKRAALSQFFGTRGKKQPINSGFFGMRGKKQPFEFRGKFVGVRGKKEMRSNSLQRLEDQLNETPFHMSQQLIASPNIDQIKRAPSGFVGMRGKKRTESDSTEQTK